MVKTVRKIFERGFSMIDMVSNPVKDMWRIFRVMAEFVEGFDELAAIATKTPFFKASL